MPKNILVILGSPRRRGNSATLAQQVIAGAEAAGAHVDVAFLHDMRIGPCSACDACQGESATDCILQDDMHILYPLTRRADALVIASPIYWFTMSAQTKLYLDRCYALGGPEGHDLTGKRLGIILTYADADPFSSGAVNALRAFQDAAAYLKAEIVDTIYGSASAAGEIAANTALMERAFELGGRLAE